MDRALKVRSGQFNRDAAPRDAICVQSEQVDLESLDGLASAIVDQEIGAAILAVGLKAVEFQTNGRRCVLRTDAARAGCDESDTQGNASNQSQPVSFSPDTLR